MLLPIHNRHQVLPSAFLKYKMIPWTESNMSFLGNRWITSVSSIECLQSINFLIFYFFPFNFTFLCMWKKWKQATSRNMLVCETLQHLCSGATLRWRNWQRASCTAENHFPGQEGTICLSWMDASINSINFLTLLSNPKATYLCFQTVFYYGVIPILLDRQKCSHRITSPK